MVIILSNISEMHKMIDILLGLLYNIHKVVWTEDDIWTRIFTVRKRK